MSRRAVPVRLLAGLLCLLAPPALADDLRHDRLVVPVPAGWTVDDAPPHKALVPAHTSGGEAAVVVLRSVESQGRPLAQGLGQALKTLIRGHRQVKPGALPAQVRSQFGIPIVARSLSSRDSRGLRRWTTGFAFAAGSRHQVVAITASTPAALEATLKALRPSLAAARVVFPRAKAKPGRIVGPARREALLHLSWRRPATLTRRASLFRNERRFHHLVRIGGGLVWKVPVHLDLQARRPADTRQRLRRWLMVARFGIDHARGATPKVVRHQDVQLASGVQISELHVRELAQGGEVSRRIGFAVLGRGWSLLIGSGLGQSRDLRRLNAVQRELLEKAFQGAIRNLLWAIACSVRWGKAPAPRADLFKKLVAKKTYEYRLRSVATQGETSSEEVRFVRWTFKPDGSCWIERHRPGVLPGTGRRVQARFSVLGKPGWIRVAYADGRTTLHPVEFDKRGSYGRSKGFVGLAIDGTIEGRYHRGTQLAGGASKYREPPKQ